MFRLGRVGQACNKSRDVHRGGPGRSPGRRESGGRAFLFLTWAAAAVWVSGSGGPHTTKGRAGGGWPGHGSWHVQPGRLRTREGGEEHHLERPTLHLVTRARKGERSGELRDRHRGGPQLVGAVAHLELHRLSHDGVDENPATGKHVIEAGVHVLGALHACRGAGEMSTSVAETTGQGTRRGRRWTWRPRPS